MSRVALSPRQRRKHIRNSLIERGSKVGKRWFMILRLYGPLEPWFSKTWRPDEIELVK